MWTKREIQIHKTVAHLVAALATLCAASPQAIVERLSGYLWAQDEAASIHRFLPANNSQAGVVLREPDAVGQLVAALTTLSVASPEMVVNKLTGHIWSESDASRIRHCMELANTW